ncbi:MAG: amidohydrolase [Granulosicoccus sp.]|nr:amidohydrolase [Granulosicoccus sp.]
MHTIFRCKKILTMNPARPTTTHVAVAQGRILGTGSFDELKAWGEYKLDHRFADKILMPGFVEGHSHALEGVLWRRMYCGYFDRMDPDGQLCSGLKSMEDLISGLQSAVSKLESDQPLAGWGFDPIYFNNKRMTRNDLDRISSDRPVGILHASIHIMNVNTHTLELLGWMRKDMNHPGLPIGDDGLPTGELRGPDVMTPAAEHIGFGQDMLECDAEGLKQFSRLCVRTGITTATDLASQLKPDQVARNLAITANDDFPVRLVALKFHHGSTPDELIERVLELRSQSTDRLRLGMIKVVADGSIQGFTARLNFPGYFNHAPNGLWYIAPEQMLEIYRLALENGIQVHTHTNGDEATDLALDMMEEALRKHPSFDHRFTIQHGQLANIAQFRRMAKLGVCVNLFANHHFYWGDSHYNLSVGPERAERMNACRSALDHNIPLAIHSDAPITPLGPLFTAWCAMNRETSSGRQLGGYECLSLDQALQAITLGAAYTLRLDQEIGSIEAGKQADFAVLNADPYQVPSLRDINVWGTVQQGRVFSADEI